MVYSRVLSLALLLISLAVTKSDSTDESALLAFKAHITSDPSNIIAHNWSTTTSFCNWLGITCGSRHRRVVALDLSGLQLKGTIPPHVGNLSFLRSIELANNSFEGSLPNELGHLYRLKLLDLSNNSLSGTIPQSLFNITTLETVYLYNNFLQGNILEYIGNFSSLQVFSGAANLFSGVVSPEIFNLSSLQRLIMYSNNISGTLQGHLCNDNSKLAMLDLGSNKLHGDIPSDLYKCKELQVVELVDNEFTGSIPREFGNFTKIEKLVLGENNFKGEIPQEIVRLVSLQVLAMETNNLHGSIPRKIGNLTSIQYLGMGINNLTGSLPIEIANCTLLQEIAVEFNHLTGTLPPEMFENLDNLELLTLSGNMIGGPIPFTIFNLSTVENIDLDSNYFSGHLPSSIGLRLPNLQGLYLGANELSGPVPNSICNASQLVRLELGGNSFSGFVPDCLGNLRNLEGIGMASNLLKSKHTFPNLSFLSSLTSCRKLVSLDFGDNPLGIHLPTSVGNLSSSLQQLWFKDCKMRGTIPMEIGNLSSLILLDLRDNKLNGMIPVTIRKLQLLQVIFLRGNKLQGYIPQEICHLLRLGSLYLQSNKLSGSLPTCLSNLTSLRELDLSSNGLTGTIPSAFWEQTNILIVNLSSNSLSGSLPPEIGNLKVVTLVDVSRNRMSGDIPTTFGSLKDVTSLSLSNNRFQGSIPQSLGDMVSLESLDLSSNNLSGVMPISLEKLVYLKYFNVSFNRLQGKIPDGGPFKNFSDESFKGNGALCGSPRFRVSPCKNSNTRPSKTQGMYVFRYILPVIASVVLVLALVIIFARFRRQNSKIPAQEDSLSVATWRRISYHELELATDGFQEGNFLGSGSFGSVFKGTLSDGMVVAVKVFKLQLERAVVSFDTESGILCNLRHRNLVKIISSCSTPDFKALVLDFMPNWSLEKWLYSHNYFLDMLQRLDIMMDVASALEYLHHGYSMPVVHRDLKPSNILLDDDMVAHVSDFGISKLLGDGDSMTHTLTLATIGYMAPEFGLEGIVSVRGDVYSFGILIMETFTRTKPTDEIFAGEMSLKNWVKQSLPSAATQVIDANLLRREEQHCAEKKDCIESILELALECCADLPGDRLGIRDAVAALKKIKRKFLKDVELPRRR